MEVLYILMIVLGIGYALRHTKKLDEMRFRLDKIERDITNLYGQMNSPVGTTKEKESVPENPVVHPYAPPQQTQPIWGSVPSVKADAEDIKPSYTTYKVDEPVYTKPATADKPSPSLEQLISTRLGVWVGAVALILGAVFLVKYSIDEGWLSPIVRVVLTTLFGASLIAGAEIVRGKTELPNAFRIAQGLCGAGLAAFYGAIYAATSMYHILPDIIGFIGLAVVTASAIISALRSGMPIAFLGLFGGFVTPLLVHSDTPEAAPLFGYLFALTTMGMMIAQRKGWWNLAWISVAGSLLWLVFWIMGGGVATSAVILFFGLPLIILSAIVTEGMPESSSQDSSGYWGSKSGINFFTIAAFAIMLFLIPGSSFDAYTWAMAFAVSIAAVILAKLRPATYTNVLIPLQFAMMMLVLRSNDFGIWSTGSSVNFIPQTLFLLGIFAVLFGGAGILGLAGKINRGAYAWLTSATTLSAYAVAYIKLKNLPSLEVIKHHYNTIPGSEFLNMPAVNYFWQQGFVWGLGALLLSSVLVYLANKEARAPSDAQDRNTVLAALSVGSTAFISLSVIQILPANTWAIGFALQALATVWIFSRTSISSLPYLVKLLCLGILMENIFHIIGAVWDLGTFQHLSTIDAGSLLLGYAIPSALLLTAKQFVHTDDNPLLSRSILYTGSLLGMLAIAHALTYLFGDGESLPHNMLYTSLFLGAGALGLKLNANDKSDVVRPITTALLVMGCWRLAVYHLCLDNPLFSVALVGSWPFINAASIGYLLPILPLHIAAQQLRLYDTWNMAIKGFFTFLFLFGTGLV
ncbi:MAG: DUF2339 domain-containing protein, partial [Alphaproteobacteria bacterium]|nr:DUF2339 domain-containing protein [Alphaproteobacteria bacterium]